MSYPANTDWHVVVVDQFGNAITGGNPLPVSATLTANVEPGRGSFTDRSGTITTGGTAQTLAAANANRTYLVIQNLSTGDMWINFTTTAVQSEPSLKIPVGATYISDPQWVSTELVSIIGQTTGDKFSAKEA